MPAPIRASSARPLDGQRIVVTRAAETAGAGGGELTRRLADAGAEVISFAATRIERLDAAPLRDAIARIGEYGWVLFTSQNAVRIFLDELRAAGLGAGALAGLRVAAVGPATAAALGEAGITVAVEPERFTAEGLLEALARREDVRGARVLYATAQGARDVLPRGLAGLGAMVDRVAMYRSVPNDDAPGAEELRLRLERGEIALVVYAAGSAVDAFVTLLGLDAARRAPAASIGPATTEAALRAGLEVAVEAPESTIPGLAAAIVRRLGR